MFNFDKAPDLPQQLKWKYANEPKLLEWTIRARNYNTFVANCIFSFMATLTLGGAFIMYSVYEGMDQPWRILSCVLFFVFILFTVSCMTHQRINYAYRFSQSGLEYCEWKDLPKWALKFLKWFSGITALIFIFLATIDPAFLIGALIGPGGMGIMYLSMANSKNYQNLQTEYHHYFLHWTELTRSTIATNREMVELKYSIPKENSIYMTIGRQYVFFNRQTKDQVIKLINAYLPSGVPCVVEKVDVLN
ncbi:hypothetical protein [Pseudomonas frederiksbergensis]|uniref:hypothetical protein n=1 Tax=Pseudomonas frederiksbergensis TaxID=104087 RepID=UPI003D22140A